MSFWLQGNMGSRSYRRLCQLDWRVCKRKNIPLSIADEYANAEDKAAKRAELKGKISLRGANQQSTFYADAIQRESRDPDIQLVIGSSKYMLDFIKENPIPFARSATNAAITCKKQLAHSVQKAFDMVITGERRGAEGGMRSVPRKTIHQCAPFGNSRRAPASDRCFMCQTQTNNGTKDYHGLRYSDAMRCTALTRTGCCGCSHISQSDRGGWKRKYDPYEPRPC